MDKLQISGVAFGQWKSVCKKQEGTRRTRFKIFRAIAMGKVSHTYKNGDYIVRYFNINLLISFEGIVMTVWKDYNTPSHLISDKVRNQYDNNTSHYENATKAHKKHQKLIRSLKATLA